MPRPPDAVTGCLDEDVILAFLEGTLAEDRRAGVEAHVSECVVCGQAIAATHLALRGSSGEPAPESPPWTLTLERGALVGRYSVLGKVGAGGMGTVYEAYDPDLDRKIALKLLHVELYAADDVDELRGRLLREAQAMARVTHPDVVRVYDVGVCGDRLFVAMEFVRGSTLRGWLSAKRRTWQEILGMFVRAGKGLAAAHAVGIVHRDFKPDNVLVGHDGRVAVTDFGLARTAREAPARSEAVVGPNVESAATLTSRGAVVGTPAYMAPEQILGRRADVRSDVFSFGVALYEALYGERPFEGTTLVDVAAAIQRGRVRAPRPGSRVPPWLRTALLRSIRADPNERFPSMNALLAVLERDRKVLRRSAVAVLAVAVAVTGAVLGVRHFRAERSNLCRAADDRIAAAWSDDRKRALTASFAATGLPYAGEAAREVVRTLDAYVVSWLTMQSDACAATRIRGQQSEELLDLRMECLGHRRTEFLSLLDLLARADAKTVEHANESAQALTPVDSCADVEALRAPVRPPGDAATRARVSELRDEIARGKALEDSGDDTAAERALAPCVEEAKRLHYRPIEAEALVDLGAAQNVADDPAAGTTLDAALVAAEASRHDAVAARAWSELVRSAYVKADYAQARWRAEHAFAAIDRMGGDDRLLAVVLTNLGSVAYLEGKMEEAESLDRRALEIESRLYGPQHKDLLRSTDHLGRDLVRESKFDEARALLEKTLATYEGVYGPWYPAAAATHQDLGVLYLQQNQCDAAADQYERALAILERVHGSSRQVGLVLTSLGTAKECGKKYDEAVAYQQRALSVLESALGPNHIDLNHPLKGLGSALVKRGDAAEALEPLERSLALATEHPGDPYNLALTRFYLAEAIGAAHGDMKRARELATNARATFASLGDMYRGDFEDADAWLRAHAERR